MNGTIRLTSIIGVITCILFAGHDVSCSDDVNSLEPVVSHLSQMVSQLQAEMEALKTTVAKTEPSVIFSVQRSDHVFNITAGTTVIFDHVLINTGDGYSAIDGEFTVPVSGLYQVSYRGWSKPGHTGFLALKKNSQVISEVPVGDREEEGASSQCLLLRLQDGDILYLAVGYISHGQEGHVQMMGEYRTTYMGILLQAD